MEASVSIIPHIIFAISLHRFLPRRSSVFLIYHSFCNGHNKRLAGESFYDSPPNFS